MRTLCFLHTLQWGLSNYLVEIPGVFASSCRDLLQASKLFQMDVNFVFLAHFVARSFELLGRNTRCVCELLLWFVASAKIIPKGCELCVSCTFCSEVFRTTWLNYQVCLRFFCTIQRHFIVNYTSLLGVFVLGYRSVLTGVPFNYNYRVNFMRWVNVSYFLSSLN